MYDVSASRDDSGNWISVAGLVSLALAAILAAG